MEIKIIGTIAISLVVLITSLLIIKSLGYEIQLDFGRKIKGLINELYSTVFGKKYYNLCEVYDGEYISVDDFETLMNAYYNKQCEDTKVDVILSFSLTREDILEMSRNIGVARDGKLIIYDHAEPLGIKAIIIDGNYSKFPFKYNDKITIWNDGYPEKDVLLNLTGVDCNIDDYICSPRPIEYDRWGCPITNDKNRGEGCECNSQCRGNLICDETNHCCPQGETWTGTKCGFQHTFTILFIQLKEKGKEFKPIENFREKVELGKDTWIGLTPLKNCGDKVGLIVEERYCEVPDQSLLCGNNDKIVDKAFIDTNKAILECVKDWEYGDTYTRIEGILPGDNVCCIEGIGCVGGYTGGYNYPLVSSEANIQFVSSHEMGHTFGLCDEAYGGGTCTGQLFKTCESKYCSPVGGGMECEPGPDCCPNKPEMDSIMCTDPGICNRENECSYAEKFAPTSYAHLEKELNEYCE